MARLVRACSSFVSLLLLVTRLAQGADSAAEATGPAGTPAKGTSACDELLERTTHFQNELYAEEIRTSPDQDTLKRLKKELNALLAQTRLDQCFVHNAVRKINENLEGYRNREERFACKTPTDIHSASPELLATDLVRRHPELLEHWGAEENRWVLADPVVAAHPEILGYSAVQKKPLILLNPSVRGQPELLDTPAVRNDPSVLLKPELEPPKEDECKAFVDEVSRTNRNLLIESYGDSIKQNANLSNQLATRLNQLVVDSGQLTNPIQREWFLQEYTLLTDRYLHSRQFRVGFGAVYAYLPEMSYAGTAAVDLSRFRSSSSGGQDQLAFLSDFSNVSYLSALVSAKAPYFDIDLIYPNLSTTRTTVTPVQFLGTDSSMTELLAQSTVVSNLRIEYDVGIRVGIGGLLERHRIRSELKKANGGTVTYYPKESLARFDWGLGVGMAGFRIDNSITTDVRLRTDPASRYEALTSAGTVATTNTNSFRVGFATAYFKFRISDEFELGFDYRRYENYAAKAGHISIGGETVSITAAYYPTFFRRGNLPVDTRGSASKPGPQAPAQAQSEGK